MIGGDTVMSTQIGSASHPGGNEASRTAPIAKVKKLTFPSDARRYNGHDGRRTHEVELRPRLSPSSDTIGLSPLSPALLSDAQQE